MQDAETSKQIQIFDNSDEVARAAAELFIECAREAVALQGRFTVALAGGSTPKKSYELLATEEYRDRVDWPKVHIFFGDERCVSPDDAESNYRMANEALLSRVSLPPQNIHRMRGEGDAAANARLYEDELRTLFAGQEWPRFDLILLGMGDDGHTASLFPGSRALKENSAWVTANWVEKFQTFRITLTASVINHARSVAFIVTNAGKAATLEQVLHGTVNPEKFPSQLIHPFDGKLVWLLDEAAAEKVKGDRQA